MYTELRYDIQKRLWLSLHGRTSKQVYFLKDMTGIFIMSMYYFLLTEKQSILWLKVGQTDAARVQITQFRTCKLTFLMIIFLSFSKVSFINSGSLHPKSYTFKKLTLNRWFGIQKALANKNNVINGK